MTKQNYNLVEFNLDEFGNYHANFYRKEKVFLYRAIQKDIPTEQEIIGELNDFDSKIIEQCIVTEYGSAKIYTRIGIEVSQNTLIRPYNISEIIVPLFLNNGNSQELFSKVIFPENQWGNPIIENWPNRDALYLTTKENPEQKRVGSLKLTEKLFPRNIFFQNEITVWHYCLGPYILFDL